MGRTNGWGRDVSVNPQGSKPIQFQSLSQEDPLEKGMTTHSGILVWKIPWTEEPGGLLSMGSKTKNSSTGWICMFLRDTDINIRWYRSDQIRSVAQSCPSLCDPMNCSMPGLPVHHHLPEFTQTHIHWLSDAIQPSHPLSSPSPPAPNPSQHQSLFQWVNSLHEVAKVLEFQL